jgi:hypothetical protein
MQFVEFEYYRDKFKGTLSESEFTPLAREASAIINRLTMRRINADTLQGQPYAKDVQDCTCAVAEKIEEMQRKEEAGKISSETIGPHSVSFRNDKKLTEAEKQIEYTRVIEIYLFGTGLLYRGLGCPTC